MTFGRLTVLNRGNDRVSKSGRHRAMWECSCRCGNTKTVSSDNLIGGRTTSCGCARKELLSSKQRTHGDTNTRLYGIWCAMKARCLNKNANAYKDYGGRGIGICDDWKNSYVSFKKWACDNGYSYGLSIDRIENSGNYCPNNCRWVTGVAQANNRRSNRKYTIDGTSHTLTEWARLYNINPKTLFTRIYSGADIQSALHL